MAVPVTVGTMTCECNRQCAYAFSASGPRRSKGFRSVATPVVCVYIRKFSEFRAPRAQLVKFRSSVALLFMNDEPFSRRNSNHRQREARPRARDVRLVGLDRSGDKPDKTKLWDVLKGRDIQPAN